MAEPVRTYQGTTEKVWWWVTRNNSTKIHSDEAAAHHDYDHRAKWLRKGESLTLTKVVRVEAWVQTEHDVKRVVKPS